MEKSGIVVLTPGKEPRQLEELSKWELNQYLRNVSSEDGADMLIYQVHPLVEALARANKRLEAYDETP